MGTLEDAAEDLVVKLRGLDSEIEESDQKLEVLRERVETATREVEQDWTDLREAVTSFLGKVREEREQLDQQAEETLQAVTGAHNSLAENATAAQNEIAESKGELDALGQQVSGLEPAVESLVAEGGEAPARSLAERAKVLEQEVSKLLTEARDFLHDEVVTAMEQVAEGVRERCEELHRGLVDEAAQALQKVYDEWEDHVDDLEIYVLKEDGYEGSHQHAKDVVEYAMDECETASVNEVEELQQLVVMMQGQLQQMATEVERAGKGLTGESGAALVRELDQAKDAALKAVDALDEVKQELAERTFM